MQFCVVNLGCKVNRVESDNFERTLIDAGWVVSSEEDADLVVVNTCTVTGEAEKKTRKAVRHALRASGCALVVVTGCAAAINADAFASMDERVQVVPKAGMDAFLKEHAVRMPDTSARNASVCHAAQSTVASNDNTAMLPARTRVGVKVQDGCNNACTYCIVHVARGKATSRALPEVVAESVALARAGVREIVLSGINIGSYSWENARLAALLEELLDATADIHEPGEPPCRFRVSSIEPMDVDDDFIELLACAEGRVCRHLHLPLQAGSMKVLHEMARPYTAEEYVALVDRLRTAVPELSLTTDIIVGFPGETDGEFAETLAVAKRCAFSKIHVFPYSRREGTPAAARADQVPPEVKAARAAQLRELSRTLRAADLSGRRGTYEWALVETSGHAMSESYHELPAPQDAAPGSLVRITL